MNEGEDDKRCRRMARVSRHVITSRNLEEESPLLSIVYNSKKKTISRHLRREKFISVFRVSALSARGSVVYGTCPVDACVYMVRLYASHRGGSQVAVNRVTVRRCVECIRALNARDMVRSGDLNWGGGGSFSAALSWINS